MTVIELYRALEGVLPPIFPETDSDGAQILPNPAREVRKVLVSLDPYGTAADLAVSGEYDLLLTHHPLFFFERVPGSVPDHIGIRLEAAGVAQASFHMRLDAAPGGVNDLLAERLGLGGTEPFGIEEAPGIGRIGELPLPVTAAQLASRVRRALDAPRVDYTPRPDNAPISRVAVVGGAAGDFLEAACAAGADALVGGEFKHHQYGYARGMGLTLVEAGHFCTETPVCAVLADLVRRLCPGVRVDLVSVNPTISI